METAGSPSPPVSWATWLALTAILALALAIRVIGLDYSLWYDEIASTRFAATPLRLLWSSWMVRETNPPLYYTLLGGWAALFGDHDAALRSLSVVIGMIGVGLGFLLGRHVGGARAGLLTAGLLAVSAQNILYSQQVRGYILAYAGAMTAILGALLFLEARRPGASVPRRWALLLYITGAGVAVYAHTTLVILPALISLFVLTRLLLLPGSRAWRPAGEWVATNALLLLLWAWWARITVLQAQTRAPIGWIDAPSVKYAVRMTLESYLPWQIGPAQYAVAALAVAAAARATWRWRDRPDHLLFPFLAVGLPIVLYLLSLKVPMFLNRTVYWGSGPFLVTVAAAITDLRPRWMSFGAAGIVLAASVAGWAAWFPQREIEPWRGIVAAIERQQPGATVLVDGKGPTLALERYCQRPRCTLSIVGQASPATDTWASGFAVPGMTDAHAGPDLLAQHHALVAIRWMALDPIATASAGATRAPLAIPSGHEDNVAATLWTGPPSSAKQNLQITTGIR